MLSWDVGLVVFSDVDDSGFIGLQVDSPGEKGAGVESGEPGTAYGVHARPHDPDLDTNGDPDAARSCGALYAFYGSRLHVWPQTDPRMQAGLPQIEKGGACFFGGVKGSPSYLRVFGDTGTMALVNPASPATAVLDSSGLVLGSETGAVPIALATQLLAYLATLETAVGAVAASIPVAGAASAAAFQATMASAASVRATIAATLVKGK